ncbi:MAG: methyltransferase [Acidobacteria bacterium]|nr:MAG: methyltransferase [Acidobacteriota bacterium]
MTSDSRWIDVDKYVNGVLAADDEALSAAIQASDAAGLPPISVTPQQGRFLYTLARSIRSRAILEVGTLGGYSTIWLARAVERGGLVTTIEADARHAEVARANITRAGVERLVDLRIGRAQDVLPQLEAERAGPFDFVFIDADKPSTTDYFNWALKLSRQGSLIFVDNVVRNGGLGDAASADADAQGMRRFTEALGRERRVTASVIQTVCSKGYDGFALALVNGEERRA